MSSPLYVLGDWCLTDELGVVWELRSKAIRYSSVSPKVCRLDDESKPAVKEPDSKRVSVESSEFTL
jgi:hypothetical protein